MRGFFEKFILTLAALLAGNAVGALSLVESTTPESSSEEDSTLSRAIDGVTFSNATVLHIEDSPVEIIGREFLNLFPHLEQFRMAGRVHSVEKDAFSSVKQLTTLVLDDNHLTAVPKGSLGALTTLSIGNNRLAELRRDEFLSAPHLQWLSLSENFISSVHPEAFAPLSTLTFLNASWNQLASLDGIATLSRLVVLDLGYNYIKLLNGSHLSALRDLQELSLRGNLLLDDGVRSGSFASLPELRRLDLGDNFLRALPKQLLHSNRQLEELTLDGNALEAVPEELFRGLTHLRIVDIRNNRLTALGGGATFRDQPSFTRLSLEGNRFVQLPPNVLRSADVLLQNNRIQVLKRTAPVNGSAVLNLFLYGNDIGTVEQDALEQLPRLETLYADYNRIAELPPMLFHASHRLQHASFAHNRLTVLRTNTFAGLAKLHAVDLSHNQLAAIEPAAFHGSPVEYLNLNGNRLRTLDDGAFLGTRLRYLHVDANEISSIRREPHGSEVLQELVELSANDNRFASLQALCTGRFPKLTSVSVRNNSLASMDAACLEHLRREEDGDDDGAESVVFNLAFNDFSTVPSLAGRIGSLDLSGNSLTGFDGRQFERFRRTETLLLRDTLIAKLSALDFAFLPHLKRVELGSKVLETIDGDSFHQLKLHHLEINDSPLKELPHGLLTAQTTLAVVSFARNNLSVVPEGFFHDCHRLEEIDLSFNALEAVDSGWFKALEHLKTVNLEGNRIALLPADLFSVEQSLESFSVAGNRIPSIDGATFLADVPLKVLNVSGNQLTEIDTLYRNEFVTRLDVSGNRLTRLQVRTSYRVLMANSNQISSLEWAAPSGGGGGSKWELAHLELADNLLHEIDPRLFEARKLGALDVSENRLARFPFELVYKLKLLHTLVLSRNNIRSLPEELDFGFKLNTLDLTENPLESSDGFLNSTLIENLILSVT